MADLMPVLELREVSCRYGSGENVVDALKGASLRLFSGDFVAVMGPSGSGKSTLLNLAGTLAVPTSGQVLIAGTEVSGLDGTKRAELRRRTIGFVFQDFNLIPTLSILDNVAFPLELDGMSRTAAIAAAKAELAAVEIADLADRFPDEVSGGQAQRAAIARALVGQRQLLLADEPTGALDTKTAEAIMTILRAKADAGSAVLMVTHEPRYAAQADRTITLQDGCVAESALQ